MQKCIAHGHGPFLELDGSGQYRGRRYRICSECGKTEEIDDLKLKYAPADPAWRVSSEDMTP